MERAAANLRFSRVALDQWHQHKHRRIEQLRQRGTGGDTARFPGADSTWIYLQYRLLLDGGCLLCSEEKPHHCHWRLVAEYLQEHWDNVEIEHIP